MTKFLDNKVVIIILSLIWGFGLALLFRKICQNDQCIVVKVPIELAKRNNIIYNKNRCYRLQTYASPCVY